MIDAIAEVPVAVASIMVEISVLTVLVQVIGLNTRGMFTDFKENKCDYGLRLQQKSKF